MTPRRLPTLPELQLMLSAAEMLEADRFAVVPENGRQQWPLPQTQPRTPLRGDVCELTFPLYLLARSGIAPAPVQKLYDTFGSYRVKPKRPSRGVIWNNAPFWWSTKGYYRPGFAEQARRPLQHYIWEAHHGEAMPPMHEIWFRDRDRHNFAADNLQLLSKAELHRLHDNGFFRALTFEQRSNYRTEWACKKSRELTALLLQRAQTERSNQHGLISSIYDRKAA
jgi:hypothetical protein